jgi:hypothetical protein
MTGDILEDRFHFCALLAYLEIAIETCQSPPDSETTRRRAYQLYEEALAEKNAKTKSPSTERSVTYDEVSKC